jgi:hypothetical protein
MKAEERIRSKLFYFLFFQKTFFSFGNSPIREADPAGSLIFDKGCNDTLLTTNRVFAQFFNFGLERTNFDTFFYFL